MSFASILIAVAIVELSCSQRATNVDKLDASAAGGAPASGGGTGNGGAPGAGGLSSTGTGGGAAGGDADAGLGDDGRLDGIPAPDAIAMDQGGVGGGPALGPIIGTPLATFDSNVDGFTLNRFVEVGNLANLATPATMTWISTEGSPTLGCVKITAPYSGPNQWVDLEAPAFAAPRPNWSGRTLHVRIKLDPSSTFEGFARLYVKTGTGFVFYTSAFAPYPQNAGWQEFVLQLVSPAPVPPANPGADPVQIATFGVDPITSGAPPTVPTPITFYVDSFSIE